MNFKYCCCPFLPRFCIFAFVGKISRMSWPLKWPLLKFLFCHNNEDFDLQDSSATGWCQKTRTIQHKGTYWSQIISFEVSCDAFVLIKYKADQIGMIDLPLYRLIRLDFESLMNPQLLYLAWKLQTLICVGGESIPERQIMKFLTLFKFR